MNPEAQRIAIAEANGFSGPFGFNWLRGEGPEGEDLWRYSALRGGFLQSVPNYPADLNAMHEVEELVLLAQAKAGDWRGWESYRINLEEMVGSEDAFHATAAQRAEAFLRTLGKWTST